jgi:uncharacterized membrane protein
VQYRRSCYNDVIPLYAGRGLDRKRFPYIHSTEQTRASGEDLEYPAGTGVYVGVVAKTVDTPSSFFNANAVGLALMGLAAALALVAMALEPRRVLLYAVGPAMILYSFHNWDLLALGLATLAMYAYWRGAGAWAGFMLGVAAATKLYPAFLLPAFALGSWRREHRPPLTLVGMFALGAAAVNVPVMLLNYEGWKYPWDFQSMRTANFETSWYMLARHLGPEHAGWFTDSSLVNGLSGGIFVLSSGALVALEARRERVRPFALGFGILVAFLLTAKVFSPQYALWLLPFFALLRMPWWSYAAFAITDAAVWFGVSAFFLAYQVGAGDPAPRLTVLEVAVWARYAVLLVLLWLSRSADELVIERGAARAPVALEA